MTLHNTSAYVFRFLFFIVFLTSFYVNGLLANEDFLTRYLKAEALFKQKKYPEALSLYENIVSENPSFINGYRGVIDCYTALGDPKGGVIFMAPHFFRVSGECRSRLRSRLFHL